MYQVPAGQIVRFLQISFWVCTTPSFKFLLVLVVSGIDFSLNQQLNEHFPQDSHSAQLELSKFISNHFAIKCNLRYTLRSNTTIWRSKNIPVSVSLQIGMSGTEAVHCDFIVFNKTSLSPLHFREILIWCSFPQVSSSVVGIMLITSCFSLVCPLSMPKSLPKIRLKK